MKRSALAVLFCLVAIGCDGAKKPATAVDPTKAMEMHMKNTPPAADAAKTEEKKEEAKAEEEKKPEAPADGNKEGEKAEAPK